MSLNPAADPTELAKAFLTLPFAFLAPPEISELADQIKLGHYGRAYLRLQSDIETHEVCDNWIKADVERKVLMLLRGDR